MHEDKSVSSSKPWRHASTNICDRVTGRTMQTALSANYTPLYPWKECSIIIKWIMWWGQGKGSTNATMGALFNFFLVSRSDNLLAYCLKIHLLFCSQKEAKRIWRSIELDQASEQNFSLHHILQKCSSRNLVWDSFSSLLLILGKGKKKRVKNMFFGFSYICSSANKNNLWAELRWAEQSRWRR